MALVPTEGSHTERQMRLRDWLGEGDGMTGAYPGEAGPFYEAPYSGYRLRRAYRSFQGDDAARSYEANPTYPDDPYADQGLE